MSLQADHERDATQHDSTTLPDDDVSRDPAEYSPSDHFLIRSRRTYGPISETRTHPTITGDVIKTCIRDGEIRDAKGPASSRKFVAAVDGVEWHLLTYGQRAITAYAPGRHGKADTVGGDGE